MLIRKYALYGIIAVSFMTATCWSLESSESPPESIHHKSLCQDEEAFLETEHELTINGTPIAYRAAVGSIVLKNELCEAKANIFFTSYTKNDKNLSPRPITFCFNGGPGSCSVWLHMGLAGPKRIYFNESGEAIPPYSLVDNESSLLDITDLVFIDPVSTGYSRAIPPDTAKSFHGVEEDIKSMAEFIRLYLVKFNRWDSPKFLMGESYGTTRAAGLSAYLHDNDFIYINGIALISSVLNFQSVDFSIGNDLPYLLYLPSYTATAWHHNKLSPTLMTNFEEALKKAQEFVINDYAKALFKGDLLTSEEKKPIIQKLAELTGLSSDYISKSNLRVDIFSFAKELLREQKRTVGRFDSCTIGIDSSSVGSSIEYDPSFDSVAGAFTAGFNQYIQNDLKWKPTTKYKIIANVRPWDYGCSNSYLNVSEDLRSTMTKNPAIRVFVANGYYDLATPFFATEYTFDHLGLDPSLKDHVTMKNYEGGHMMYLCPKTLIKLKQDLADFYQKSLQKNPS